MCGIVGYAGDKPAIPVLLRALKDLEYRGYDSAGIVTLTPAPNGVLTVTKKQGKIVNLESAIGTDPGGAMAGIGHTRWATHGKPSDQNAHPHLSCGDEVAVIHNGIGDPTRRLMSDFSPDVESETPLRILCIGRLIPVKRFDMAIRAISVLRREFPDVHLTIAGAGPLHAELHSLVKDLDLGASVSLPGYVSDTGELFRKSDIFVLPSETEGSPITLIEAMAYAKPIVASEVGAIPEMVSGHAGAQLLAPCNLEQLIDALRRFMSDPAYCRVSGRLARKRFERNFTAETMAARYGEQYESCLRGAR